MKKVDKYFEKLVDEGLVSREDLRQVTARALQGVEVELVLKINNNGEVCVMVIT